MIDNIKLVKADLAIFSPLYVQHFGAKSNNSFMRTDETWKGNAEWLKEAYFFEKNNIRIGGVFITDKIIYGLFTIPPFEDYSKLLDVLISNNELTNHVYSEVPENNMKYYPMEKFNKSFSEVLMSMENKELDLKLAKGYSASVIKEEDINEVALVMYKTFTASKYDTGKYDVSHYESQVRSYFQYTKNEIDLFNSTKVIRDNTDRIVGVCLSMIDAGLPFIMNVAVDPDHQKKGLGRFLVESIVSGVCCKYESTRLFVNTENTALHLYESIGFNLGRPIYTLVRR